MAETERVASTQSPRRLSSRGHTQYNGHTIHGRQFDKTLARGRRVLAADDP